MPRSQKEMIKRKQVVKEEPPEVKALKKYIGDEKLFECEKCDYKCNWMSNLNMHTRAKHEKLKMDCDKCNYSTTWKVALLYHRRFKHGIFQKNTKYKELLEFQETICEKCGFAGSSKMTMGLHNKSGCDRWM